MGRATILLVATGLAVLVLSSYSEGHSRGKFLMFKLNPNETLICLTFSTLLPDPFTEVGTLGRLYFVGTKLSWLDAKKQCERLGSHLVEIWTDKQYKQVKTS